MKTRNTMTAILKSRNERQDSATRPPELIIPESELAKLTTYEQYERVVAQRDELLAALKKISEAYTREDEHGLECAITDTENAIAKYEALKP